LGGVYHIDCYWTTDNDPEFSESRKFDGSFFTTQMGLVLGTVRDRNNNFPNEHVICGFQFGTHFTFWDIRRFDFLNPQKFSCSDFNFLQGKGIGYSSTVSYTEVGHTESLIQVSDALVEEDAKSVNEICQRFQEWICQTDYSSIQFLEQLVLKLHSDLQQYYINEILSFDLSCSMVFQLQNSNLSSMVIPLAGKVSEENIIDLPSYIRSLKYPKDVRKAR